MVSWTRRRFLQHISQVLKKGTISHPAHVKIKFTQIKLERENRDVSHLEDDETGKIKNIVQHVEHLKQKGDSLFEEYDFRHNIITRRDFIDCRDLNISSRPNVSTKPPSCLAE